MERLNIVKISVLFKLMCGLIAIPVKIPAGLFVDLHKLILKFICKVGKTEIA